MRWGHCKLTYLRYLLLLGPLVTLAKIGEFLKSLLECRTTSPMTPTAIRSSTVNRTPYGQPLNELGAMSSRAHRGAVDSRAKTDTNQKPISLPAGTPAFFCASISSRTSS